MCPIARATAASGRHHAAPGQGVTLRVVRAAVEATALTGCALSALAPSTFRIKQSYSRRRTDR